MVRATARSAIESSNDSHVGRVLFTLLEWWECGEDSSRWLQMTDALSRLDYKYKG